MSPPPASIAPARVACPPRAMRGRVGGSDVSQSSWSPHRDRSGRLPTQCRHRADASRRPRVLGAARAARRLAVPAGRDEHRRDAARGDVPRAARRKPACVPDHVAVLGVTPGWLRYRLPQRACAATTGWSASARSRSGSCCSSPARSPTCAWTPTDKPEFDHWRWVDFWYPVEHVVTFKRRVYEQALRHLAPFARQIAGAQAIPQPRRHLRADPRRRRHAARPARRGAGDGQPRLRLAVIDNHSHLGEWRNPAARPCTSASAMASPNARSAKPRKPAAHAAELTMRTGCGASCGSCLDLAAQILDEVTPRAPVAAAASLPMLSHAA